MQLLWSSNVGQRKADLEHQEPIYIWSVLQNWSCQSATSSATTPRVIKTIYGNGSTQSFVFKSIRNLNANLAFASMKADQMPMRGAGPPVCRLHWSIYHHIGSLEAPENVKPLYTCLYFHDPSTELDRFAQWKSAAAARVAVHNDPAKQSIL